jgi:hypothetical protein
MSFFLPVLTATEEISNLSLELKVDYFVTDIIDPC